MPANSQGPLSVTDQADGVAEYTWSLQTDYVTVTNIPSGGTTLNLPADAQSGDEYGFALGDDSLGDETPITVRAATGQSLQGTLNGSVTYPGQIATGRFRFDQLTATGGGKGNWTVIATNGPQSSNLYTTASAQQLPAVTQGPAASVTVEGPAYTTFTGRTKITAVISVQASAAGTGVTFSLHNGSTSNPALGPSPVVGSSSDTNHQVTCTLCWIDTTTPLASNTYLVEATASTGTVTAVANGSSIVFEMA